MGKNILPPTTLNVVPISQRKGACQEAEEPIGSVNDPEAINPDHLFKLLNEKACEIHQALSVLRMTSRALFEEAVDNATAEECYSTVDAAITILEPIAALIDDEPAMRGALEKMATIESVRAKNAAKEVTHV